MLNDEKKLCVALGLYRYWCRAEIRFMTGIASLALAQRTPKTFWNRVGSGCFIHLTRLTNFCWSYGCLTVAVRGAGRSKITTTTLRLILTY